MGGSLETVASAIARTALPVISTAPGSDLRSGAPTGNVASSGGEALPSPSVGRSVPQIDFSRIVRQLDAFVENGQRSLHFREDAATGRTVMTVVNPKTKEVIRQVPAEELLVLAQKLDGLQGQLINAEA